MKSLCLILCIQVFAAIGFAQTKKVLDHADFAIWNQINNTKISNDGNWVSYVIVPGEGDPTLVVYHVPTEHSRHFPRATKAQFTEDSHYLIFTISPPEDTLKAQRRRKVEKDDLPTDTLAICHLASGRVQKIPDLQSVEVPEKWNGYLVYQVRTQFKADEKDQSDEKKEKKPSKENGFDLIIRALGSGKEDTLRYVTEYTLAQEGQSIAALTTGQDSVMRQGVYVYLCRTPGWKAVKKQQGKYRQLAWNTSGDYLAFVGDTDTTKAQIREYALYQWKSGMDSAIISVDRHSAVLSEGWSVSEFYRPKYSKNGSRLHFGIAPPPLVEDTSLLEEEKANVEVWHYKDPVLYTQQNVTVKAEKERAYHAVVDLNTGAIKQIANEHLRESHMDRDGITPVVILTDDRPYHRESSWTGELLRDVWVYDIVSGRHRMLAEGVGGSPDLSPELSPHFRYVYWYHAPDSLWYVAPVDGEPRPVSEGIRAWDEENDRPMNPYPYGIAGWLKGDEAILICDRYDIWKVDPSGEQLPINLTKGRESRIRYRYADLDRENTDIDPAFPVLLHVFHEDTKRSGYALLNLRTNELRVLVTDAMYFQTKPLKARDADVIVYTTESFQQFPDLHITTDWFESRSRISDANPQQKDYRWGTIELYSWTAYDGRKMQGLLVKPEGFDPAKKYPMIVNFYEKSSDELHRHRAPYPHRSTINYTFYASRGYVIFNPDVTYQVGYPGESAYNSVVSGTIALINEGFIDPQRIGLQGHSWGGYQVAYILTRTGMYRCAEAGAPVVNMVSAYGGIRWETGLSRMFQYEHEQSRIGGSLWEKKDLYLENSPIFHIDKISTPVLILNNDHDGHVPWYQGIEFFVAMRRLDKPAWMLNYPGEPHWPLKLPNRKDFNIRMQQFFDHYLMDAPMPKWMRDGVPAVERGILHGYELIKRN